MVRLLDGSIREAEFHWYEAAGIGKREFKTKRYMDIYNIMNEHQFAICIDNRGYEVSLEIRKLYEVLLDADAEKHGQIRVIDESREDYLYPATAFTVHIITGKCH